MTLLPSLADVIRETLTDEVIRQLNVEMDHPFATVTSVRAYLLSALLVPLSAREQGLQEERDKALADYQFMVDKAASNNLQHYPRAAKRNMTRTPTRPS